METANSRKTGNFVFISIALVPIVAMFLIFYFAWDDFGQASRQNQPVVQSAGGEKIIRDLTRPVAVNFSLPELPGRPLRALFFGDLMLDRHVGEKIKKDGLDHLFSRLTKDFFAGFDLVGANLEGAVTDSGGHYPPVMSYDFAFHPDLIAELKEYNFNFFNIANNHLSDQGERGIVETGENLEKSDYVYFGCADKKIGDCSFAIAEFRGKKIGLVGFSMVYGLLDEAGAEKTISDLASVTDIVIVNIHWGREYEHNFNITQKSLAHKLIDAGADAIIGHHPHVVQGMDLYGGKPIFYSLGNFIFDQYFSSDTQEGLALALEISDREMAINLYPFKSKLSRPELMAEDEKKIFFDKFLKWSKLEDKTAAQIKIGRLTFDL